MRVAFRVRDNHNSPYMHLVLEKDYKMLILYEQGSNKSEKAGLVPYHIVYTICTVYCATLRNSLTMMEWDMYAYEGEL